MKERKLTGNEMFKMVQEECERILGKVKGKWKKRQTGVFFRRWENRQWRWFRNGNKKKDRKYVGNIRNGGPNGQGTLIFPDGDKYVGKFKDGEYHGQGTYTFHDGAKYVGEFKNGKVWNGTVYNGNIEYKIVKGK